MNIYYVTLHDASYEKHKTVPSQFISASSYEEAFKIFKQYISPRDYLVYVYRVPSPHATAGLHIWGGSWSDRGVSAVAFDERGEI